MDRTSFYEWRRRFQTHGLDELKDLPAIPKEHPLTTPEETKQKVLALSLTSPARGCNYLWARLALKRIRLSAVTVQNIPTKNGPRHRYEPLLTLERQALAHEMELPELAEMIEKANRSFQEGHVESSCPPELLCQHTFYVGNFKGVSKVHLHRQWPGIREPRIG